MKHLIPLIVCVCLLAGGCNSKLDIAPGVEAYQQQVDSSGKVSEQRQGARLRLGSIETEAAPQAAAETANDAAGKFKEGGEANASAAKDAKDASINIVHAALIMGAAIIVAIVLLGAVLLIRRKD